MILNPWITILKSLTLVTFVSASLASATTLPHPHMDLELSGAEYQKILEQERNSSQTILSNEMVPQKHIFDDIFATGKRNLDWLQVINKNRTTPISLTTPETQVGYPIDNPRTYNPKIIRDAYLQLQQEMPSELKKVIFGNEELPNTLPVSDEDYILWGLKVDREYQIAARWKTMEPYMDYLKSNSMNDIRGYYFLTTTEGFPNKLKDWPSLTQEEQMKVKTWLLQVCRNDLQSNQRCLTQTENAINANKAFDFFNQHKNAGQDLLNEMMFIPSNGKYSSAHWTASNEFHVPFVDPMTDPMRFFLTNNIETEWKFLPFTLLIDFVQTTNSGVEVIWEPGITPHVPSLGSNKIYMDSNAPISEYDVQWTIRHEFGHVLGFPDCYIEFYDGDIQAIVGYQIDITDLMCSRRGHLKARHITELKKNYN